MPAKHVFNYRKRGNTAADKEKKKKYQNQNLKYHIFK